MPQALRDAEIIEIHSTAEHEVRVGQCRQCLLHSSCAFKHTDRGLLESIHPLRISKPMPRSRVSGI